MEIIAFVDTETGGLTPDRALLSVGVVVVEIGDSGRGVWPCYGSTRLTTRDLDLLAIRGD